MTVKRRLMLFSVAMIAILLVVGHSLLYLGKSVFFGDPHAHADKLGMSAGNFWRMRDSVAALAARWENADSALDPDDEGDAALPGPDTSKRPATDGHTPLPGEAPLPPDPEALRAGTETLRQRLLPRGGHLELYKDTTPLVSDTPPRRLVVPDAGREYTLDTEQGTVYVRRVGDYELRLSTSQIIRRLRPDQESIFYYYVFASVGTLVLATICINFVFSRFIFRRIETSIQTLSHGVRQVRDGNLDYRIRYPHVDEFAELCTAFNEMAEQLAQSEAKKARDEQSRRELVAGISHDLRTPLTSIKAYAEGLESELAQNPEKRRRYLETIRTKVNDMENMISQLLLFSKLDTGTFPLSLERLDLRRELDALLEQAEPVYGVKGLRIRLDGARDGLHIRADRTQLKNAVVNIIENSLKYATGRQGELHILCEKSGPNVRIRLSDNGPGVPEADLERIFEVFYRCDPARSNTGKGSGLGLAITARLMAQLGGSARAANVPGGGLAITLTFPVAEDEDAQQAHSDH